MEVWWFCVCAFEFDATKKMKIQKSLKFVKILQIFCSFFDNQRFVICRSGFDPLIVLFTLNFG